VPRTIALRHGLTASVLISITLMLAGATRVSSWRGVWSETQAANGVALILALPVIAGISAWVGASARSNGIDALIPGSARLRSITVGRESAELCAWVLLGFVGGVVPTYIATTTTAHSGSFNPLTAAVQILWIASTVVTAGAIGRKAPRLIGAPLCAVAMYVGIASLDYFSVPLLPALTPIDDRWMTFDHPATWLLLCQAGLWLSALLAVIAMRSRADRTAWALLWLAGLCATPALYLPDGRVVDPAGVAMSCTPAPNDVVTCFPHAKAYLAGQIGEVLATIEPLLRGLHEQRVTYVDEEALGLSVAASRSVARVTSEQAEDGREVLRLFDLSGYSQFSRPDIVVELALQAFPPTTAPGDDIGRHPAATPSDALLRWFLGSLRVPIDGSPSPDAPILDGTTVTFAGHQRALARFAALDASDRRAWFASHRMQISAGTLTWGAFDDLAG
jgi:hypothetical protein